MDQLRLRSGVHQRLGSVLTEIDLSNTRIKKGDAPRRPRCRLRWKPYHILWITSMRSPACKSGSCDFPSSIERRLYSLAVRKPSRLRRETLTFALPERETPPADINA